MTPDSSIDLIPIAHKLEGAAFQLFRNWTAQLKGKPEVVIKDERVLVQDLREAFESAIRTLNAKDADKRKPEGWDLGFVAGVIQGNLETKWYHDYVARTTEEYKTFAALKAMEAYLGFDKLTCIRVENLYSAFLTGDSNLEDISEEAFLRELDTSKGGKLKVFATDESGKLIVLIKNLILEQIFRITNLKDEGVDLDVTSVFTWEEIAGVVRVNSGTATSPNPSKPRNLP